MPYRYILSLILTVCLTGCWTTTGRRATDQSRQLPPSATMHDTSAEGFVTAEAVEELPQPVIPVQTESLPPEPEKTAKAQSPDGESEEEEAAEAPMGIIFLKTHFEGVVNTGYVVLTLGNESDPEAVFRIRIQSGNEPLKPFPWKTQQVEPGYIAMELPPGEYAIQSITIPVGSAQATEDLRVRFEVLPDVVTYLGTLRVVGSKEKLKLGGVPVIKPGFEYTYEILNEKEEALEEFPRRFPEGISMQIRLMQPVLPSSS